MRSSTHSPIDWRYIVANNKEDLFRKIIEEVSFYEIIGTSFNKFQNEIMKMNYSGIVRHSKDFNENLSYISASPAKAIVKKIIQASEHKDWNAILENYKKLLLELKEIENELARINSQEPHLEWLDNAENAFKEKFYNVKTEPKKVETDLENKEVPEKCESACSIF